MKKQSTKAIWAELLYRRLIGGLLANCAYNLDQKQNIDKADRAILKELQQKWDRILVVKVK